MWLHGITTTGYVNLIVLGTWQPCLPSKDNANLPSKAISLFPIGWFSSALVYTPHICSYAKGGQGKDQGFYETDFSVGREFPSLMALLWAANQLKDVVGFLFYFPSFISDSNIFRLLVQSSNQPSDYQPWNTASQSMPPQPPNLPSPI